MTPYEIIAKKRDGQSLSQEEIEFFILKYMHGEITDYQMAAFLMAVYLQGMNYQETSYLTRAYIDSGIRMNLSDIPGIKVDKHSTGGVGDKVSLILAPLVASLGVPVPMISGRGLGHSGGTLDKLESIPGFQTDLSGDRFRNQVGSIGVAMIGQTEHLVPADRRIYALRDVTATVDSIPLITASIMSKKIAEGIDALVLDVKYGNGAFMREVQRAEFLARNLIRVGKSFQKQVVAILTSMEQPLGYKIGNWLEIQECLECFQGQGPEDLLEVTLELSSHMLVLGEKAPDEAVARQKCREALQSGVAFQKFLEMARAQGGDIRVLEKPQLYPAAAVQKSLQSEQSGFITRMNTREIGMASVELGAGRLRWEDPVDPQAGIVLFKKTGDPIKSGEDLLEIHTNKPQTLDAALQRLRRAINISEEPPETTPQLILKKIDYQDV